TAGEMPHATQRQLLRAVFGGGDMADRRTIGAHGRRLRADMPVGVDLHLDAAIGEDALRHYGDEVDPLHLLADDEWGRLEVRIGGARADGRHEAPFPVDRVAVPLLLPERDDL